MYSCGIRSFRVYDSTRSPRVASREGNVSVYRLIRLSVLRRGVCGKGRYVGNWCIRRWSLKGLAINDDLHQAVRTRAINTNGNIPDSRVFMSSAWTARSMGDNRHRSHGY